MTDNAYDPDVRARQFWIDKTVVKGQECLSFMDDGNGLDHEAMHKMLRYDTAAWEFWGKLWKNQFFGLVEMCVYIFRKPLLNFEFC